MDRHLAIGEVARRTGVAASALRFYESRASSKRSAAKAANAASRAAGAAAGRLHPHREHVGLSLEEIGQALSLLPAAANPPRGRLGADLEHLA